MPTERKRGFSLHTKLAKAETLLLLALVSDWLVQRLVLNQPELSPTARTLIKMALIVGLFGPLFQFLNYLIDAGLGACLGGVIGARIVHVLLNWAYFADNLSEALHPNAGGLDWHGAVIGGLIGLALVAWVRSYVGDEFSWDLRLVLKRDEVPAVKLGQSGGLGWATWLHAAPPKRDADDLVLRPFAA